MQSLLFKPLAVSGFLLFSSGVLAAPVNWQINGVLSGAGSTWAGSFTFDADTLMVSNVMVETDYVDTTNGPSTTYMFGFGDGQSFTFTTTDLETDQTGGFGLAFQTANPLTNLGGTEAIGGEATGEVACLNVDCTDWGDPAFLNGGTVSSVPLPAAAWLFGSALLGLGVIKRNKA